MAKNGKLDWESPDYAGTPNNIDPDNFPNMQQVANYVFNAVHLYLSGQHAQNCPTCQGQTQGIPANLLLSMASAINGILEALEKGIPVVADKVVLNEQVLESILHPKDDTKAN